MRSRILPLAAVAAVALGPGLARAEMPVQRSVSRLPSANGHSAVMVDLAKARVTHFREHLFATEEPQIDAANKELFTASGQPLSVPSRDLLFDAYFGLRSGGKQAWLTGSPVDLDLSGYAPFAGGAAAGTGIARMVQRSGALRVEQFVFSPRSLGRAGFVLVARVVNEGMTPAPQIALFSIHNFHLGFGRPGVMEDLAENGETLEWDPGTSSVRERGFAGLVTGRAVGTPSHHALWTQTSPAAENGYQIVSGGSGNLPDPALATLSGDGAVSALQFELGDLAPGADAWAGVVFAHHADPFAGPAVDAALSAYVGAKGAKALVDAELAEWSAFQASVVVPPGALPGEEALFRQSAAVLRMAQVEETEAYLREFLSKDGEPRYSRFGKLPGTIKHHGQGAILASLPPGEWTVTWSRDTAYAIAAMSAAGMKDQAKAALGFYLNAEAGRFQGWDELKPYSMPPYQISLVRYHGFGVEETDLNDFGPNLEFDGFGLFLWALRRYEVGSGDLALAAAAWPAISTRVGDVLVALVDPATGMLRKDSSIWETHWKGRERSYAYTTITAVRGLCDASVIAERLGDTARAATYKKTATALRKALIDKSTDAKRALAVSPDELAAGDGYWDAAVLDAIAMGLVKPDGVVAKATLAGLDAHLLAPGGAGWSRNDDRTDHAGKPDVSPWGSEYDSAEWVFTDMRGSVATRLAGDTVRSERLLAWVKDQSAANYYEVSETYDEATGAYKFNSPMVGFGAGAYMLAVAARNAAPDPACGAYADESGGSGGTGGSAGVGGAGGAAGAGAAGAGAGGGSGGAGGSTGGSGSGGAKGGASGASAGNGGAGNSAGGLVGGSGGAPPAVTPPPSEDVANSSPGCGCVVVARPSAGHAAGLFLGLALLARGRRRPRQQ